MKQVLIAVLATLTAGCSFIKISTKTQPLEERTLQGEGDDKIVLVAIEGMITESSPEPGLLQLKQPVGMLARLKEELDLARDDEDVRALVIKVDSPGGSVAASDIIFHELSAFKEEKKVPVVVIMMGVAASGGYYVSCAADRILAHPTTVTGSIGVIAFNISAAGLLDMLGIENKTLTAGEKKDMLSPLRPYTEEERLILEKILLTLDTRFLEVVTKAREPSAEQLAVFSDARVLDAQQAVELGLVDSLGYMEDAIAEAQKLAGVKRAKVVTYARPDEYRDNVYSVMSSGERPRALGEAQTWVERLPAGLHFMYLWSP